MFYFYRNILFFIQNVFVILKIKKISLKRYRYRISLIFFLTVFGRIRISIIWSIPDPTKKVRIRIRNTCQHLKAYWKSYMKKCRLTNIFFQSKSSRNHCAFGRIRTNLPLRLGILFIRQMTVESPR